jgi:hypothetical protein
VWFVHRLFTRQASYLNFTVQGCTLYNNWWPMLTLFFYVLIPMPYLFFGAGSNDSFYSSGVEIGYESPFAHQLSALLEWQQTKCKATWTTSYGTTSYEVRLNLLCSWMEAGKFLTGMLSHPTSGAHDIMCSTVSEQETNSSNTTILGSDWSQWLQDCQQ